MGRSSKAARNVVIGVVNKILMLILAFGTRTLFIRLLGAEYSGVSSLYTNILSVLSLAELGLSNVLMFYLYGALKRQNEQEICLLVQEFKKIYTWIIAGVMFVGVAIIPFLQFIVKSSLRYEEVIGYYLLYLINSVASYFVVYRIMVVKADQKDYITNIVQTICTCVMYIIQILYLLVFKNFLGYLVIQVLTTVAQNLILNAIALHLYPYLNERVTSNIQPINKDDLIANIKATFLFKVSDTILDQTDSIIISIMFGTVFVGYYFNYFMLISYVVAIAGIIANGLVASFGNLNAEGDMEKSYKMFRVALMGFAIIGTFCTACYACVVQDFIPIWIGAEYVMNYSIVVAVLLVFYLRMVTNTTWMYRSSMGIFREVQYINVAAAGLNIILSIVLGMLFGVAGVIVATAVSRIATSFWYEGKVIYARFNKPVVNYYLQQLKDFIICIVVVGMSLYICKWVTCQGPSKILIKLIITSSISLCAEFLAYHNTDEFKFLIKKIETVVKRK